MINIDYKAAALSVWEATKAFRLKHGGLPLQLNYKGEISLTDVLHDMLHVLTGIGISVKEENLMMLVEENLHLGTFSTDEVLKHTYAIRQYWPIMNNSLFMDELAVLIAATTDIPIDKSLYV